MFLGDLLRQQFIGGENDSDVIGLRTGGDMNSSVLILTIQERSAHYGFLEDSDY